MPISLLDLIVLGIVFISALLAMMRGFTREVLAIASWAAAAAAAYAFYPLVLPYVREYISNATASLAAAIGAVFLVTLIVVSLVTVRFSDFILDSKIGALDRTLGFAFGSARGFLLCIIGFIFFSWLVPPDKQPDWVRTSKTKPYLQTYGETLMSVLPDDPEATILKRLRKPGDGGGVEPPAVPVTPAPQQRSAAEPTPQSAPAANPIERQRLQNLVEQSATPQRSQSGAAPAR